MEAIDLYEKLKLDLYRFARSIARHEQEANDLVQDALVKALGEKKLYSLPEYKQRAWFYRVMKNQLIDERRMDKRLIEWEEDLDIPIPFIATEHLEMSELLSQLPLEFSDLIFKRYWLGLSSKEIGEQVGVPASTVRYKLHLGIKQLREIMEEEV
ncbi:RNA polymerase sigma-70 factor (ECF subfamily) [Evansella vedderi]|uniref:RNA polymerase sigma-70 factor (ECF subfamily) n=1 Tax=Evansella vedderi TaxID=38282 RepID=A0ABT9ZRA2_9BACI|nr:RNA polymerase sigma factor [Evansella vedderi]MDQ0253490.1 RNA polymerase sigma-70 factor (ECF subfamily) [Evansella vedderi]